MIKILFKKLMLVWAHNMKYYMGPKPAVFMIILSGLLFAQVPEEWDFNFNEYEDLMTITSVVVINGIESTNTENVIAAFVNNECRGVGYTTETLGSQLFFLMIYSNTSDEAVTFKLYDAGIDSVVNVSNAITFSAGEGLGSVDEPYEFIANYYVNSVAGIVPERFNLLTSYPNPFNNLTNIQFEIVEDAHVILSVFNVNGELVAVVVNERKTAGDYVVPWNSKNILGADCPSGEYIIQLMANDNQNHHKVTLIK